MTTQYVRYPNASSLLAGAGGANFPGLPLLSNGTFGNPETAAAMTLFVNGATGSDTNDGLTSTTALATITEGIRRVPLVIKGVQVTINVAAGTYAEGLSDFRAVVLDNAASTDFRLVASDWTTVTPITGSATGTIASVSTATGVATITLAGWTASDFKGKFLKLNGGSLVSKYIPIFDNAATTLTLPLEAAMSNLTGQTFTIVTQAVFLSGSGGHIPFVWSGSGSEPSNPLGAFHVIGFSITAASGVGFLLEDGSIHLESCNFTNNGFIAVNQTGGRSLLTISYSYIQTSAGLNGISVSGGLALYIGASAIASSSGNASAGITSTNASYVVGNPVSGGKVIISNATLGMNFGRGATLLNGSYDLRTCTTALRLGARCTLESVKLQVSGTTTTGILAAGPADVGNVGGFCSIQLATASSITGCSGDGIRLSSNHNFVRLEGTTDVSNNTGFAVNLMPFSAACSHNFLSTSATATMATNTAGDIAVDGATSTTLATLRAATRKTVLDGLAPTVYNSAVSQ